MRVTRPALLLLLALWACTDEFATQPIVLVTIGDAPGLVWLSDLVVTDTLTVGIQLHDGQGRPLIGPEIAWASSDDNVLDVQPATGERGPVHSALVTARSEGAATITVRVRGDRFENVELTRDVQIGALPVSIRLDGGGDGLASATLGVARSDTIVIVPLGRNPTGPAFRWESSNPSVLRVDADPFDDRRVVVTGVAGGEADLIASTERPGFERQEARLSVVVEPLVVAFPNEWPLFLTVTGRDTLSAVVLDEAGEPLEGLEYTWDSSDDFVLSVTRVDADPTRAVIQGRNPGSSVVSVRAERTGFEGAFFALPIVVSGLTVEQDGDWPTSLVATQQDTVQVVVRVGEAVESTVSVEWLSSNPNVVTVAAAEPPPGTVADSILRRFERIGVVTARGTGEAEIIALVREEGFASAQLRRTVSVTAAELEKRGDWPTELFVTETGRIEVAIPGVPPGNEVLDVEWAVSDSDRLEILPVEPATATRADSIAVQFMADIRARARGPVEITVRVGRRGDSERATVTHSLLVFERWRSVVAGIAHTCAIAWARDLYCWGGGLGIGRAGLVSTRPIPIRVGAGEQVVKVVTTKSGSVNFDFEGSGMASCAITVDGPMYCWGDGSDGKLGTRDLENRFFPTAVQIPQGAPVRSVGMGTWHTCAVVGTPPDRTRTVCWGRVNTQGFLGIGVDYLDNTGTPTVEGIERCTEGWLCSKAPRATLDDPRTITAVSAGQSWTCGIAASERRVYCWGAVRESGDTTIGGTDPEGLCPSVKPDGTYQRGGCTPRPLPITTSVPLQFDTVAVGGSGSCALEAQTSTNPGQVWCWGNGGAGMGVDTGGRGALGPNCLPFCAVAEPGAPGLRFSFLSMGLRHTCAIERGSRAAWCWGGNANGELGRSSQSAGDHPDAVRVSGNLQFESLDAGFTRTCGVTTRGAIYCWGRNRVSAEGGWLVGNEGVDDGVVTIPVRTDDPDPIGN